MNDEILMLQEDLLKKENKIEELRDKIYRAKKYIKENSIKIGRFNVIIEENEELKYLLEEKIKI